MSKIKNLTKSEKEELIKKLKRQSSAKAKKELFKDEISED